MDTDKPADKPELKPGQRVDGQPLGRDEMVEVDAEVLEGNPELLLQTLRDQEEATELALNSQERIIDELQEELASLKGADDDELEGAGDEGLEGDAPPPVRRVSLSQSRHMRVRTAAKPAIAEPQPSRRKRAPRYQPTTKHRAGRREGIPPYLLQLSDIELEVLADVGNTHAAEVLKSRKV